MHVLTLIAPPTRAPLGDASPALAVLRPMLNPVRVVRLSAYAVDFHLEYHPPVHLMQAVAELMREHKIDMVIQPVEGRAKSLLISDMDSTMIEQECIDELADCVGLKPQVAAITERAMNGELDFAAALRERVALLKGLPESALHEVFATRISLMPGARTLVATMKARGAYTVLVSGGFQFFTSRVALALGFDAEEGNVLEITNGKLTGTVAEPILGKDAKLAALDYLAAKRRVPMSATLAVGDGANDVPMLRAAGLGVAYHAKPVVEAQVQASIRFNDLSALLYVQGIPQSEFVH
jgi:phosphoserine phosphatase